MNTTHILQSKFEKVKLNKKSINQIKGGYKINQQPPPPPSDPKCVYLFSAIWKINL